MKGLWRDDFEGSRFCPAPAKECTFESGGEKLWLDAEDKIPGLEPRRVFGALYAIEFVGRRMRPGRPYGHLGVFDGEISVDRLVSLRELEPAAVAPCVTEEMLREANASEEDIRQFREGQAEMGEGCG